MTREGHKGLKEAVERTSALRGNLTLLAVTVLLLLPVAEALVRIFRPQPLPSQEFLRQFVLKDMYMSDERAGFRLTPHFSGAIERNGVKTVFSTDSLGLRGDEPGPKSRFRILGLGDSMTWGMGVGQGEDWVSQAAREINRLAAREICEGINGGVNGYGTANELGLLEEVGPILDPDLVLVGFFPNDYRDNLFGVGRYTIRDGYLFDEYYHNHLRESWLARESHFWRLLGSAYETARVRWFEGIPGARAVPGTTWDEFRRGAAVAAETLIEMDKLSRSQGARLAVVWLPPAALVFEQAPVTAIEAQLREVLSTRGVSHLDLLPIMRAEYDIEGLYIANDGHFSHRGNQVVARAVGRWLLREGLVRH